MIRIPKGKKSETQNYSYKLQTRWLPEIKEDLLKEHTRYSRELTQMATPRHVLVNLQDFKDKENILLAPNKNKLNHLEIRLSYNLSKLGYF